MINQCVECGESNSVLVIGPRGSGKSKVSIWRYSPFKLMKLTDGSYEIAITKNNKSLVWFVH